MRRSGFVDFHSLRKTLATQMAVAKLSQRVRQSHMRPTNPSLTENTYMDQRLLPVAEELSTVPWIPDGKAAEKIEVSGPSTALTGAPPGAPIAPESHRKTAIIRLELSPDDNALQEEVLELVIRGTRSQVLQIQRIGQALCKNDKTSQP